MQKQNDKQQTNDQQGLVVSYFGNTVAIEGRDGQIIHCHLRRNQALPVVGDQVNYEIEGEKGVVTGIMPRSSVLMRGEGHGKQKPLAANLQYIVIMMPPPPSFSTYLVDRYLSAAILLNIQPLIVINKIDLVKEQAAAKVTNMLEDYANVGIKSFATSVLKQIGLSDLYSVLKNHLSVLLGPSGVGKSSLISAYSKAVDIKIGEVSYRGAGKHTTTATRYYHLPDGGGLIDSPGVREFTLWAVTPNEVIAAFPEYKLYSNQCKFRDCRHLSEPHCAVREAVETDKISKARYESYQTLLKEAIKTSKSK